MADGSLSRSGVEDSNVAFCYRTLATQVEDVESLTVVSLYTWSKRYFGEAFRRLRHDSHAADEFRTLLLSLTRSIKVWHLHGQPSLWMSPSLNELVSSVSTFRPQRAKE